jgi:hypothetical protein
LNKKLFSFNNILVERRLIGRDECYVYMIFGTVFKKVLVLILLIATINISVAHASTLTIDIGQLVTSILTNPTFLVTFFIEFALGLGLGFFSVKVFKYIIALIGIFLVGVILNVWQSPQLGTDITSQLRQLGLQ